MDKHKYNIPKKAASASDWLERVTYGAGGAGLGGLLNYTMGGKSLLSYLTMSGLFGAGGVALREHIAKQRGAAGADTSKPSSAETKRTQKEQGLENVKRYRDEYRAATGKEIDPRTDLALRRVETGETPLRLGTIGGGVASLGLVGRDLARQHGLLPQSPVDAFLEQNKSEGPTKLKLLQERALQADPQYRKETRVLGKLDAKAAAQQARAAELASPRGQTLIDEALRQRMVKDPLALENKRLLDDLVDRQGAYRRGSRSNRWGTQGPTWSHSDAAQLNQRTVQHDQLRNAVAAELRQAVNSAKLTPTQQAVQELLRQRVEEKQLQTRAEQASANTRYSGVKPLDTLLRWEAGPSRQLPPAKPGVLNSIKHAGQSVLNSQGARQGSRYGRKGLLWALPTMIGVGIDKMTDKRDRELHEEFLKSRGDN